MSIVESILLGLLQGVAEFLPISSSGHLALAQKILGLEDVPLLFDVFLHLATLAAVCIVFRQKIWSLLCSFGALVTGKPLAEEDKRYIIAIVLATFVTGAIGIVVEKLLPELPVQFICCSFIFTACLLILSSILSCRKKKFSKAAEGFSSGSGTADKEISAPSWKQALIIGLAQGLGTFPGVSRSGSTISGALLCGVTREKAGEFSFVVSIPAILAAFLLELKDMGELGTQVGVLPVVIGCIVAFVSGVAALSWLMRIVRNGRLGFFAFYLIPVGILGLIFLR